MQKIGDDPSENEMFKIRSIIDDFVELISEHKEMPKNYEDLDEFEDELKKQILQKFRTSNASKREVELEFESFIKSESFKNLSTKRDRILHQLSDELREAQKIEDVAEYWDEIDRILDKFGLYKSSNSTKKVEKKKQDKKDKKPTTSFKISFNDYLK